MQLFVRQYSGVSVTGRPLSQQDAIMVAGDITMNQELNAELTTEVQVWQQSALVKQFSCNSAILLAVADGVSASPAASTASRLVLKHLAFLWQGVTTQAGRLNSGMIRRCQHCLTTQLGKKPTSYGASTTVAALEVADGRFKAINAGDSRVWRYRQGVLEQLSVDHCFAQELQPEPGQQLAQCYQALTSYLAADPDAEDFVVSVTEGTIQQGDQFLLTTDGIHDEVPKEALTQCLALGEAGAEPLTRLLSQFQFDDNASLLWLCT